jgi:glutamate dehydrogenase (NAD(P)+)
MNINRTTNTLAPGKIPDSPLFIAEIKDLAFELQGWVVIHSLGSEGSCGGVRLYPNVTREEVELLAKTMTYKFCFYERTMGGAKAGLKLPFDMPSSERAIKLRKFGEHISPLLRSNIYHPGIDMNSTSDDLMHIYQGAGIKINRPVGDSAYFAALSTFSGVIAAAEYYHIAPEQCKITIEGLGNVGKYLALEIDRWGGKLIGASTRIGAVANLKGINVKEMIKALEKSNDFWVKEKGNWETFSKEQLFSLPMNIHVPCARVNSVTERVAKDLNCRVIVPAANVPCTSDGEIKLNEKGIKLLPDFVINGGGIIGTGLSDLGSSDDEIRNLFFKDFKEMVERLLKLSDLNQTTATRLASLESHKNFRNLRISSRKIPRFAEKIYKALEWRGLIPKGFILKKKVSKINYGIRNKFN